ncbi:plasmid replication protein RepC [Aliirhizobium cellulosilyticum]|uniref:Replication initiation protein RepC n=1 Tax=Aliirhizobium cellulosilyticum TaxID=393664 RepID=A0A7W6XCK4_9HYPH|nr:replication initiation protein RepC [Rhizobium cellulosilyticum]MBB4414852.1 replication initiation protein RepC [Rhizobium cellulosilyticum]MBB4449526.1 replication initiation protein RepC [Rhizobium cellulosilyticum]
MTSFNRRPALPAPISDFALRLAAKNKRCEAENAREMAGVVVNQGSRALTFNSEVAAADNRSDKASRSRPPVLPLEVVNLQDVFKNLKKIAPKLRLKPGPLRTLEALAFSHRTQKIAIGEPFIVFRSNRTLSTKTGGTPESTLRDHFKVLIKLAFMVRKDSPNGQRRAPRGSEGEACGFDLSLLISRAKEFAELARDFDNEERDLPSAIRTLDSCRRELEGVIANALAEHPSEEWRNLSLRFEASRAKRIRNPSLSQLRDKLSELHQLREEANALWIKSGEAPESGANGNEIRRHIQSTSLESLFKEEVSCEEVPAFNSAISSETVTSAHKGITLDQIRRAYPSLVDYGPNGAISSWPDFERAVETVKNMFQITTNGYEKACQIMGHNNVALTIAYILQRGTKVESAGAYLHGLAKRYRQGKYSPTLTVSKYLGRPRA